MTGLRSCYTLWDASLFRGFGVIWCLHVHGGDWNCFLLLLSDWNYFLPIISAPTLSTVSHPEAAHKPSCETSKQAYYSPRCSNPEDHQLFASTVRISRHQTCLIYYIFPKHICNKTSNVGIKVTLRRPSCSYSWSGKSVIITYAHYVFVVLSIQAEMCMNHLWSARL